MAPQQTYGDAMTQPSIIGIKAKPVSVSISVVGDPAAKGSPQMFRNRRTGKPFPGPDSDKLVAWSAAVRARAIQVAQSEGLPKGGLAGPLSASLTFLMPRPAGHSRWIVRPVDIHDLRRLSHHAVADWVFYNRTMLTAKVARVHAGTSLWRRVRGGFKMWNGLKPNAPTWHSVRPDLDKLIRGTWDPLHETIFGDDCQIVRIDNAEKRYAHPDEPTGCTIVIRTLSS